MIRSVPRLVRRIACGYAPGRLPGEWLQTWRRLASSLERAGLDVRATLDPLDELPADADVLLLPPELAAPGGFPPPAGPLLITTSAADAPRVLDELVARIAAGADLTANRLDPDAPRVVTYRGTLRAD